MGVCILRQENIRTRGTWCIYLRQENRRTRERVKARFYIWEHEFGWACSPTLAACVQPSDGTAHSPILLFPLARQSRARGKSFFIYTSLLHVAEGGDAPKQNYTSIIQTINYTSITRIIYYAYHCLFFEKSCRKCDELHKKSCPKCDNSS